MVYSVLKRVEAKQAIYICTSADRNTNTNVHYNMLFCTKTIDYTVTVYFKIVELINLAKKGEQIGRED